MTLSETTPQATAEEVAQKISQGHSLRYHVFGEDRVNSDGSISTNSNHFNHPTLKYGSQLGITEETPFFKHNLETLTSADTVGYRRSDGGGFFFNQANNTFVIFDPNHPDFGTSFRSEYGVEYLIKNYDKDVNNLRASPNPSSALVSGGWDAVMAAEPPQPTSEELIQSHGDRRTAARQALQELGVQAYTPEGHALRKPVLGAAEHHAARGVGAASLAVNIGEGDYGAAAVDAAGLLGENSTVQKAAAEVTAKVVGTELLEAGVKKIPIVGAVVTVGTVLYASGAQAIEGNYRLAAGELVAGVPEIAGNIVGFGAGDALREGARQGLIAAGGDEFAAVEKSGLRQLGEAGYTLVTGKPVAEVLPANHASMAQGADGMGARDEVSRIAVERMGGVAQGHLVVLQDGSVQPGTISFGNNPQIAAGKNGGTLGILYAGTAAMNDAQWSTVQQVNGWLGQQRAGEGLSSSTELIAGSTATAELNNLPTPRGPLPTSNSPQVSLAPVQPRRLGNGMGGM